MSHRDTNICDTSNICDTYLLTVVTHICYTNVLTFVNGYETFDEVANVVRLSFYEGKQREHEALLTWLRTHVSYLLHRLKSGVTWSHFYRGIR